MGIPAAAVPASRSAYREFFERMRPHLCVSEASRNAIEMVVNPPLIRCILGCQLLAITRINLNNSLFCSAWPITEQSTGEAPPGPP
jgi:uncharacterized protein (DUF2236 family)